MKKNTLLRILGYLGNYKLLFVASIICAILSVIMSLISPYLIGVAIDNMVAQGMVDFEYIAKSLFSLFIIYAISNTLVWLLSYLTNYISFKATNDMRRELFNNMNQFPLKFYDTSNHGDIISRFTNDIDAVSDGMVQGISTLLTGISTIIGAIGFMIYINPSMTLVVLVSAPASFFVARYVTKNSQRMFKEQAKTLGNLNGYVEEYIGGLQVVQLFNAEEEIFNKFKKINNELYDTGVKAQFYGSLTNPSTRLINNMTYSIVGIIGGIAAILGKITVGNISSFLIYSNLFAKPFNEISGVLTQIQAAIASADRIFNVMDMKQEKKDGTISHSRLIETNEIGNLVFKDVSFSYSTDISLIKNFNLKVKAGSRIAIVGKTGSGKTTLVNLLMRFYDINSGSIYLDNADISEISRDKLRRYFGIVLQDSWLFEGTIFDNIAYGEPDASYEEVVKVAKEVGAHNFIMQLPKGYSTTISSAGENLSQGQKQLITIARVMLINPPMLILDEATSNIDTRTEIRIQKAFLKLLNGRTSFIIAHRLSTIKEADLILVMDNGNVVESGNHDQLIKMKSYYYKLYNSQFEDI
ncbi:ABC transporter ATP-binding protein [Clostridium paridis]|uniref:ABC transporter ATP-binding protein n=1 Tax=Clostridium paridis TaxID=2803863 RepID=A0A937FDC4_9CLOT|nr:ABC transporter ATP-binding protein [Clostridium paridis]MBL4930730.1 ABC transporter ATP-binding protein [Clostridium paridis]